MTDTVTPAPAPAPPRRSYAKLAADESREDYSLRYAPHSFRRWGPGTAAGTALGASIVFAYGFTSGAAAILAAAAVIFLTGIPIARAPSDCPWRSGTCSPRSSSSRSSSGAWAPSARCRPGPSRSD